MTMTLRKGSKDKLGILSMESTDSSSSMESIELKQLQPPEQQQQQQKQRAQPVNSFESSPPIARTVITFFAALLILSPALTLPGNRSLLEKNARNVSPSSLRSKEHGVAKVVNHHQVQKLQSSVVQTKKNDEFKEIVEEISPDETPTIESKPNENAIRRTILFHIGPPKTGSTTLQCHLGLNFATMVEKDNFYYLGTWHAPLCGLPLNYTIPGFESAPRPILLDCYAPHIHKECNKDDRWREFGNLIQKHHDMGHNLIVSDEMFHHHFQREDVQRLRSLLLPNWNVKILYTYRHFYSSVPSMYHQLNDPYATENAPFAVEKTIWPNEGGYRIRSFRESTTFEIHSEMDRFSYWAEEFGTVHVFNMESSISKGDDYLLSFLCTMMPELKAFVCDEEDNMKSTTTSSSDSTRNDNSSAKKFLHYDMLAVAAKDAGLLDNTSLQRTQVRDAIQQYCELNGWNEISNFALDCLSEEEMESFLRASLDQAKTLQEYFLPSQRQDWPELESEIRTGFTKHAERNQFCSIDTETSLKEERWKKFFRSINDSS